MTKIRFGQKTYTLPGSRWIRIPVGLLLIVFGLLGFLPVVGFWMIPLGLIVLSIDLPIVRRWRRRATVKLGTWLKRNHPGLARKMGFQEGPPRR